MDWKAILLSEQALALYGTIILVVWRWLARKYQWNKERWEGLVANAYLIAEKACPPGVAKSEWAQKIFSDQFKGVFGKDPTAKDLADAALDFGKLAFEHKAAAASGLVVTPASTVVTINGAPVVPKLP